jgi:hypothetical protein
MIGNVEHPDFRDAMKMLREEARVVIDNGLPPELIIVAQSRPDALRIGQFNALRRAAPLAGVVALVGSWCEGETRTGRPWPGVPRVFWYEFPAWWRRQMRLRLERRCPDWARPADFGLRISDCGLASEPGRPRLRTGAIALRASFRAMADALADVCTQAGYATIWQRPGRPWSVVHGAVGGIWDGAQLCDDEASDLAEFCTRLAGDNGPVIALLDYPRRDCVERAIEIGVATVLAKPWRHADLIATIEALTGSPQHAHAA